MVCGHRVVIVWRPTPESNVSFKSAGQKDFKPLGKGKLFTPPFSKMNALLFTKLKEHYKRDHAG